jgi:hypothetical protein
MVDGLHIRVQNSMVKPLANAFSGARKGLQEGDSGGNIINV